MYGFRTWQNKLEDDPDNNTNKAFSNISMKCINNVLEKWEPNFKGPLQTNLFYSRPTQFEDIFHSFAEISGNKQAELCACIQVYRSYRQQIQFWKLSAKYHSKISNS
jgi:hypothetical protein